MIKSLIRNFLITAGVLILVSKYITGFHLNTAPIDLLILIAVFMATQIIIKPILQLFLGLLNFLTFGFIALIIDTALLYAISIFFPDFVSFFPWVFPGLEFQGIIVPAYAFNALGTTFVAASTVSLMRSVLIYLCS